jgi:hypothetical protein
LSLGEARRSRTQIAAVLVLLAAVYALGIYATYTIFTSRQPGANDFYPRWVGGCALLGEGINPYSEAATLRIQQGMYGGPASPDQDQAAFAYPLYSVLFFFPLCAIGNYALVQAIWFWLLLGALVTAVVVSIQIVRWQPQRWLWLVTILWAVGMYHSFRALVLGQLAVLVFLTLVAALWALQHGHDGWAGLFLALTMVKPQMLYLAIPWILLWAAGQRRWRLWAAFGGALATLVAGSMLLLPTWPLDFVRQVLAYPAYTVYGSLTWMIVQHWLGLGRAAEVVVLAVLALSTGILAWRLWRGTWEQMLWMLGLLLLLTNFFTPRIATTNFLLLLPWALWGFRKMQAAWKRTGAWAVLATQIGSMVGLWALFLTTVQGDFEQAPVYFPFPAAMMLLLIWLWRSPGSEPAG